jgi:hypothetical protein
MLRGALSSAALAMLMVVGTSSVFAQSLSRAPKSSGEVAAVSRVLAEKQENCRFQAKQEKLSFLKRRSIMRACMKEKT